MVNMDMLAFNQESGWNMQFYITSDCPKCNKNSEIDISMTVASIKAVCRASNCEFFYRRIPL